MNNNNDSQHSTNNSQPMQWDTIYTYTRSQAVADGFQIEVTKTASRPVRHAPSRFSSPAESMNSAWQSRPVSLARTSPADCGTWSGCFASQSSAPSPALAG